MTKSKFFTVFLSLTLSSFYCVNVPAITNIKNSSISTASNIRNINSKKNLYCLPLEFNEENKVIKDPIKKLVIFDAMVNSLFKNVITNDAISTNLYDPLFILMYSDIIPKKILTSFSEEVVDNFKQQPKEDMLTLIKNSCNINQEQIKNSIENIKKFINKCKKNIDYNKQIFENYIKGNSKTPLLKMPSYLKKFEDFASLFELLPLKLKLAKFFNLNKNKIKNIYNNILPNAYRVKIIDFDVTKNKLKNLEKELNSINFSNNIKIDLNIKGLTTASTIVSEEDNLNMLKDTSLYYPGITRQNSKKESELKELDIIKSLIYSLNLKENQLNYYISKVKNFIASENIQSKLSKISPDISKKVKKIKNNNIKNNVINFLNLFNLKSKYKINSKIFNKVLNCYYNDLKEFINYIYNSKSKK